MSTTRLQEVLICFGKGKQADIATAQAAAAMWRFSKINAALANPKLNTENDAEEYGKGHEFADRRRSRRPGTWAARSRST